MIKKGYQHILFVHPLGYKPDKASSDISRIANITPPLGLASMCAYLAQNRISSDIIDCYAHPDSDSKIMEYILREQPDFLGFSCSTSTFLDGVRLASMARTIKPDIKVIFGGAHVSALKERIIDDYTDIDFVVVGEGEQTILELVESHGSDPSKIKSIVYRSREGSSCFTGYRKNLLDLDLLPFPAYEKLHGYPEKYKLPIFNYPRTPHSSCISSRGCPYSCSYCDRSVFRKSFRYNSAEYLYDHFKYLNSNFGIKHVNFYDDQFTFNKKRVIRFCELMLHGDLRMSFNCAARAEHLDLELVTAMKAAGCWMISLGIETGDENLLAQHRQNANLEMLKGKIKMIKKAGIRVKALLMMGLPGESEQSIKKSKKYVFSLPIDDFNLAKFTPFPGSPIYQQIKSGADLGTFNESWEDMDCMEFLFVPKGITKSRLDQLFIDFYRSHFMRHKVLLGYISMIWKSPDSWRRFFINFFQFMGFLIKKKRRKD